MEDHKTTHTSQIPNAQTNRLKMNKALWETQTLRAGCNKAEPKIFAPPQTPSSGRRTAKI